MEKKDNFWTNLWLFGIFMGILLLSMVVADIRVNIDRFIEYYIRLH